MMIHKRNQQHDHGRTEPAQHSQSPIHFQELPSTGFDECCGPREDILTSNKSTAGVLTLVHNLNFVPEHYQCDLRS